MADVIHEASDVTKKGLNYLARHDGGPAISIYMPLQTPSAKASGKQENMIRLKNLVRRIEERSREYLLEHPKAGEQLSALVQPLREAREAGDAFWDAQARGAALFFAPGIAKVLSLQHEVSEAVYIDSRFHLKPLIAAYTGSSRFYLLSLDMHNVTLYLGNGASIQEIPFKNGPPELPEILKEFSFERTLNRAPGNGAIYVGHAGGEENLTPHIVEFLEGVDRSVRETIGTTDLPLLLAGTENVVGHFRSHTKIKSLLEEYVHGSPRAMSPQELHDRAWRIIERVQEKEVSEEIRTVAEAIESDQGARELSDICRTAYEGRLQILLVAEDAEARGSFDPERELLHISDTGEDILDLAAHYAWTRGTRVYAVPRSEIPGGRLAAGVVHPT
ncbi:MAG: hypothetical protein ACLFPP_02690 [Spirochaetaceae bacterium]